MRTLRVFFRCFALLLAASLALATFAQDADPPGRVAYLSARQGNLSMSPAGDDSWYDVIPNRPLTAGDRLWADRGARAELHVGPNALRMDGQTDLALDELTDQTLRVSTQQGRLQLRVRDNAADQRIELGTGNLTMVVRTPGDYRVLVDPQADSTQIMVAEGTVTVHGENGQVQELRSRQQAVFVGRDLAPGGAPQALSDDFERWLAARDQAEEQSQSARYVSREMPGYQQLDAYGQWQTEPGYGAVWYPSQVAPGWAPYSDGYWITVAPWGLTWVDRAPWGFAPFHYGRWTRIGARWCWVPGQRHVRPVYAPALVAFVGGGASGASFTVRGGQPAVGWFPLAPGDRWRPAYRASDRYIERANRVVIAPRDVPAYANRGIPNAVTAVPADRFGRGPISRRDHVRPPDPRVLNQAQVLPRPPVQLPAAGATTRPGGAAAAMGFAGRRASAVPPAAIQARQQPEWRQRFEQQGQQQQQRDQARSAQRQQELQERAARDQQDAQRRGMQEQQQLRNQQQAQQQQEQARRQAEQQQEQARRQAEQQQAHAQRQAQQQQQQQEQMRRQAEQQQENVQRQARQQEQQAQRQAEQEQRAQQSRRQMEQQAQQQEQARRQAEQQQQQAQRQAQQQQQEQMRRQSEQQQAQAQRQAQQQQQEQMRRQAEQQQQANAQRQAQQQQEQMRRQAEQQQRAQQMQMQQQQAQRAAQMQAQQQQQQMQQQQMQQQRQQQQQQAQQQRQRGGPQQPNDPQQQQQRP